MYHYCSWRALGKAKGLCNNPISLEDSIVLKLAENYNIGYPSLAYMSTDGNKVDACHNRVDMHLLLPIPILSPIKLRADFSPMKWKKFFSVKGQCLGIMYGVTRKGFPQYNVQRISVVTELAIAHFILANLNGVLCHAKNLKYNFSSSYLRCLNTLQH